MASVFPAQKTNIKKGMQAICIPRSQGVLKVFSRCSQGTFGVLRTGLFVARDWLTVD